LLAAGCASHAVNEKFGAVDFSKELGKVYAVDLMLRSFTIRALALLAIIATATPARPATQLDPYTIYGRCIDAMRDRPVPAYASYLLSVDAHHIDITRGYNNAGAPTTTLHFGLSTRSATYRVWYRERDATSLMQDTASSNMTFGPPVPWALEFRSPAHQADPPPPKETVRAGAVTIDEASKLLSQVSVNESTDYRISLAGMENDGGNLAYRLMLVNKSGDPNAHPLRELIVDASTFRARQVDFQLSQNGSLFGGALDVRANFGSVGPYWLNTDGAVNGGGHYAFLHMGGSYTYRAASFSFPADLPNAYFDPTRYRAGSAISPQTQPLILARGTAERILSARGFLKRR
jgi:hypothetical protein